MLKVCHGAASMATVLAVAGVVTLTSCGTPARSGVALPLAAFSSGDSVISSPPESPVPGLSAALDSFDSFATQAAGGSSYSVTYAVTNAAAAEKFFLAQQIRAVRQTVVRSRPLRSLPLVSS